MGQLCHLPWPAVCTFLGGFYVTSCQQRSFSTKEQEATVYLFLRDDHSEQLYKSGERIEFLWTDGGKEPGKWCEATFVRKSVGDGDEVKIRYQHEQRDIECTAKLRQVRPEDKVVLSRYRR